MAHVAGGTLGPLARRFVESRRLQGRYSLKSVRVVQPRLDDLARHFGDRPLAELDRRAIEEWLETLGRLAPNSRAAYLVSVRQFTRWLLREDLVDGDACAEVEPLPRSHAVPRALPAADVAAVLAHCRDDRDRAIIWLMVGLACRRAEVATARWELYDARRRLLVVTGKGGKERALPVPDEVAAVLRRINTGDRAGPIIRSKLDGVSALTQDTVGHITSKLCWAAGVKHRPYDGVSPHAFRHTAASDVLDECGNLRTVMEMLGHEHLSSTAIYLRRANLDQLRSAMAGRSYIVEEAA